MIRKSPQQKKAESYAKDRRNTYGENQKASRKNIPRSKQLLNQAHRATVRAKLRSAAGIADAEALEQAESGTRTTRLKRFSKKPDTPLREVVADKLRCRERLLAEGEHVQAMKALVARVLAEAARSPRRRRVRIEPISGRVRWLSDIRELAITKWGIDLPDYAEHANQTLRIQLVNMARVSLV